MEGLTRDLPEGLLLEEFSVGVDIVWNPSLKGLCVTPCTVGSVS